ncbi:gastrula zinc finger protein XlCGF28.1-like [Silurus meridionalis]|nr:gastrula zinc finger protein XlCGF28.1-like [Silurus meridionalis]
MCQIEHADHKKEFHTGSVEARVTQRPPQVSLADRVLVEIGLLLAEGGEGEEEDVYRDGRERRSGGEWRFSTTFLGVHLADKLTWSLNTSSIPKKAQQHLYFLRRLRKTHLPPFILTTFYRGTIESILSSCITAWFGNCTVSDRKTRPRIVRTAEKIIGVSLPFIMDIYTTRCIRKANSIVDDHTHPSHTHFTLLPSGKRFRSIRAVTTRLCNSFFSQGIRLLNTQN